MYNQIKIRFLNKEIILDEYILFNDLVELLKSNHVKCYRIMESSNSFGEYTFIECHLNSFYHKQIFLKDSFQDKWIQTKARDDIYCKKELIFNGMGYHFTKDIYHLFDKLKINDSYSSKIVRTYLDSNKVIEEMNVLKNYYLKLAKSHNNLITNEQQRYNTVYDTLVSISDEDSVHSEVNGNYNKDIIQDIINSEKDSE